MNISAQHHSIKLAKPFSISRGTRTHVDVVRVLIEFEGMSSLGECTPYPRYGESVDSVIQQIESFAQYICTQNVDTPEQARAMLQRNIPAGAARNALDCAFWQSEISRKGSRFPSPYFDVASQIETAMTVSIATPAQMAEQAKEYVELGATLLKVKLDDQQIIERVAAIRRVAPQCKIVLDANEAWLGLPLAELFEQLANYQIAMIEQPVPAGQDDVLQGIPHPIPLCADESCHTSEDLPALLGRYEMINIKLDKTGGLTEALRIEELARDHGFSVMVGCMLGTSIAMKAALPIATRAEIVDLDGPVLLGIEEPDGLVYQSGQILVPHPVD
ncbi:N-acetyl-D-Glu racemase DgcA [Vibrio paucivorans]|uniref:Dipeptide epimerase n=1 Tax=Vibrio paucivorans TaxID=2829489 RepID=A0A9X3HRV8_9VIBR|nr:N-acetyl-D-Glu racemase DgcA [Vibrio paucivorans]MCW8334450.1 L-Ala-D/L-Glu epimerase [Vibrio paucivorans]